MIELANKPDTTTVYVVPALLGPSKLSNRGPGPVEDVKSDIKPFDLVTDPSSSVGIVI